MIGWGLVGRCVRRWYVVVLGLAFTAAVAANIGLLPGVYWARTQVLLLGPPSEGRPNKLDSSSAGLIATAGLIEREMNVGRRRIPATSIDVTLLDQGVYDGVQVRLPNRGGQWANNFDQPVLDVQASGPSRAVVQRRLAGMTQEIERILQRRQDDAGVTGANRITVALSPPEVQVHYVRGDRRRAVLVTAALGLSLTVTFVSLIDRRLLARRPRNKPQLQTASTRKTAQA
jgi:hypothetical protein